MSSSGQKGLPLNPNPDRPAGAPKIKSAHLIVGENERSTSKVYRLGRLLSVSACICCPTPVGSNNRIDIMRKKENPCNIIRKDSRPCLRVDLDRQRSLVRTAKFGWWRKTTGEGRCESLLKTPVRGHQALVLISSTRGRRVMARAPTDPFLSV